MEKERKIKTLSLVALVVAVLGLTVAFAALNAQLTIEGSAKVSPSTWEVYFESATVNSNDTTKTVQAPAVSVGSKATTITLPEGITLKTPGDKAVYDVVVKNNGSIDAKIGSTQADTGAGIEAITYGEPTCEGTGVTANKDAALICGGTVDTKTYEKHLIFTLTYADGSPLKADDVIKAGETKNMKLTIGYKNDEASQENLSNDVTIKNLSVSVNYVQAD